MKREHGLLIFLVLALICLFPSFSFLEQPDLRWYDFAMRHAAQTPADPALVPINIDASSIDAKTPWPYRPAVYSRFLDEIEKGKPALVYMDVLLEAAPQISPEEYKTLLDKIKAYGNVILPLNLSKTGDIQRLSPGLEQSVFSFGVPYVDQDADGKVRRLHLLVSYKNGTLPSVPLLLAGAINYYLAEAKPSFNPATQQFDWWLPAQKQFASALPFTTLVPVYNPGKLGYAVDWRDIEIPDATEAPDMFINYKTDVKMNAILFRDVLDRKLSPERFRGKLILVYNSTDISDAYYTPLSKSYLPQEKFPGGEILGYATNTILTKSFIVHQVTIQDCLGVFCVILFYFFLLRAGQWKGLLLFIIPAALYLTASFFLFMHARLWISWGNLALSSSVLYSGSLIVERLRVSKMISLFIPKKMAESIERTGLKIGGVEVLGTAMFIDMQGYTSLTEKSTLKETFELLRDFHEKVERLVDPFGGVICDWQGDGVLIFFSRDPRTPTPVSSPEDNAVRSAIRMREAFAGETIPIGIGIASGQVLWGFMGTSTKAQPTCIGDPVNLASRLQGIGKRFSTVIAVDQGTFAAAAGSFDWEEQGPQMVRGKADPVVVYTPKKIRGA